MGLLQRFEEHIKQLDLFTKKDKLLLAVSGGLDSVVLCDLCAAVHYTFAIAHCNFQLRGEDSLRDENFVRDLAARYNVPFFVTHFDTKQYAEQHKLSTQEAARVLRYDWFEGLIKEQGFDYLLTAHHADDNVETVLMNLFRGTGIRGLAGMRDRNGHLVRPLLFSKRSELEAYLDEHQLTFVQDESNLHDDYTRNYFRNTLLPGISKVFPAVQDNLIGNIERMKEAEAILGQQLQQLKKKLLKQDGDSWRLPVLLSQKAVSPKTVLYEIVREYGFSSAQSAEVFSLLDSGSGKFVLSATHRILRDRKHLIITPLPKVVETTTVINGAGEYACSFGKLHIVEMDADKTPISDDAGIACVDAALIRYPLLLRRWKTGDYFYPLGMAKKKKVSRFLIDKKLSLADKEKVWVVEMDKKIIWLVGLRIDDRFKVRKNTKKILRLSIR
ncbi:MAG: tRNA lysidine(34) synthetase TilS [Niabella sp.]